MKFSVLVVISFAILKLGVSRSDVAVSILSEEVKRSLVTMARTCMSAVEATVEDLEKLRQSPPYPEKSSCIINCLFEKVGIIKDKKYSQKGFLVAIMPLVFQNKKKFEYMRNMTEACDKQLEELNPKGCDVGNQLAKCIATEAPELLNFSGIGKSKQLDHV